MKQIQTKYLLLNSYFNNNIHTIKDKIVIDKDFIIKINSRYNAVNHNLTIKFKVFKNISLTNIEGTIDCIKIVFLDRKLNVNDCNNYELDVVKHVNNFFEEFKIKKMINNYINSLNIIVPIGNKSFKDIKNIVLKIEKYLYSEINYIVDEVLLSRFIQEELGIKLIEKCCSCGNKFNIHELNEYVGVDFLKIKLCKNCEPELIEINVNI